MIRKTVLFLILLLPILANTKNANANMFNKFRKGFYFEKYSTAEEAKNALLKLHPIGSDVGELVKTLEGAGAKVTIRVDKNDALLDNNKNKYFFKSIRREIEPNHYRFDSIKVSDSTVLSIIYEYDHGIINPIKWRVFLWNDNDNKITDLNSSKDYMGL